MINVLVVDDRDIIRDSLKLFFVENPEIQIVDEASDGVEAFTLIKKNDYDVVLMDVNMPKMDGIEATKKILRLKPRTKVLVNSFYLNSMVIKDMIRAGALGFIKKGESKKNYIEAIKTIAVGSVFFTDEINYKIYQKAGLIDKKEAKKS